MKKDNIIQMKTFSYSLEVVRIYRYLVYEKKEFILSKQFLRCGTSIGANVEEAIGGQTRRDFISKLSIAYKEARENRYWIRLLKASDYLEESRSTKLLKDLEEICKILARILCTCKGK